MIIQTSGTATTPAAGTSNIYTDTLGRLVVKKPAGTTAIVAGHTLATLADVSGTFTSGQIPIWNGTNFVPGADAVSTNPAVTIVTSGEVEVVVLLRSTVLGGSATVTWSGIEQDYDYLEVDLQQMQSSQATGAHVVSCYVNGDTTTSNYIGGRLYCNEFGYTTPAAYADSTVGIVHAADKTTANTGKFYIPHYAKAGTRKWFYSVMDPWRHTTMAEDHWVCQWKGTAAINMMVLQVGSNIGAVAPYNFLVNSLFCLYGHKRQWVVMSGIIPSGPGISHGLLTP